jgi:hypothetical protein
MQPYPNSTNRFALADATHSKSYDPSADYRAMMMPPPPTLLRDPTTTNIDPKTGVAKRIPQFYYPRYDNIDEPLSTQPYVVEPTEIHPNFPPPSFAQQPIPLPVDPYAPPGQYYPYPTYYVPMTTNYPSIDPTYTSQEQSKSDIIAAHKQDADLNRLEVYHFTPKNASSSTGTVPAPPIVQYHVYPYPPAPGTLPPTIPPQPPQQPYQQFPSYNPPWYSYPPNVPPYAPEPSQPVLPFTETKARGSQTEEPLTKNRGVSPVRFTPPEAPIYDDDGYPYIHHRKIHTDRYNIPTGRINRGFYDTNRSTPLADCRCLDCQRERAKVLNYYPD